MHSKITPQHLQRRAVVYVRQSTTAQLIHNQESQRRQYQLTEKARQLGFQQVDLIDEDLGRSGSGLVERPGFQHLVAEVCTGQVGAVFCIEASRLARNGRDWHHLIELCGLIGVLVIDPDGVYDPRVVNDRLLLGLKGTMSEFELNLLRQRSREAVRQKAKRGELQFRLPVGFCWTPDGKVEIDPDRRVQQAVRLVFRKMEELGSARQVLLWFRGERVLLPCQTQNRWGNKIVWKPPVYHSILGMWSNPMYAGAYAFGKTEARTMVVDGRARKTEGHRKPRQEWEVLIRDHHPGYISWEQFERNQAILAENNHMKSRMGRRSGRGGRSLLAGLLRCRRCGRMLHVTYSGKSGDIPRYHCRGAMINHGTQGCISFGGLRPDQAVAEEILQAIAGNAVEAAVEAAERVAEQRRQERKAFRLELTQARYEEQLAVRRYEAVDPENRLVAAELEARWNAALQKVQELERKVQETDLETTIPVPDKAVLLSLAQDLPAVWNSPATDRRVKQRIVRILIQEIMADIDEKASEVVLLIHWAGGRHSELRFPRNRPGRHGRCTSLEAVEVVRRMAGKFPDEQIVATLNRLGLRTGAGNTWKEHRVRALRSYHRLPAYDPARTTTQTLTLEQAAQRLGVTHKTVRRLIESKTLPATQVVPYAPWEIPVEAVESELVLKAVTERKSRLRAPQTPCPEGQTPMFSGM